MCLAPRRTSTATPFPSGQIAPLPRFAILKVVGTPAYWFFFLYAMRRVDCPKCGVKVERVAWAEGKSPVTTTYAELHCHSDFSFLDGASPADDLVERATELGLSALAVTDHQGLYGAT